MENQISDEEKLKKQQEFFEKARKGVLLHIFEKGGSLEIGPMHEYSMQKYLIQHQRFSQMMESFVEESLIDFDDMSQVATLTQKGKEYIQK